MGYRDSDLIDRAVDWNFEGTDYEPDSDIIETLYNHANPDDVDNLYNSIRDSNINNPLYEQQIEEAWNNIVDYYRSNPQGNIQDWQDIQTYANRWKNETRHVKQDYETLKEQIGSDIGLSKDSFEKMWSNMISNNSTGLHWNDSPKANGISKAQAERMVNQQIRLYRGY